jgi:hypothetical protein
MEMPMPQATPMAEEYSKLNTVVYHLYITDTTVNYTGKEKACTCNQRIYTGSYTIFYRKGIQQ